MVKKTNIFSTLVLLVLNFTILSYVNACGSANQFSVEVDSQGNLFSIWHEPVEGKNMIKIRQKNLNEEWGAIKEISNSQYDNIYPILILDNNGNGLAIWTALSKEEEMGYIAASYFTPLNSWSSPQLLSLPNENLMAGSYQGKFVSPTQAVVFWNILQQNENESRIVLRSVQINLDSANKRLVNNGELPSNVN